jgi:flagellar hook-associated protein 1 FlgK
MGKISSVMDIGKRSLMNSQNALQTVSHNIASKDLAGFSRQRAEFETAPAIGEGNLRFGTGARTKNITRTNDEFLEKQIQNESSKLGTSKGEADTLVRVENVFNEQQRKGLNQFVTEFFNAVREMANSPDSQATRDLVRQTALSAIEDFKRVNDQLKGIQHDVDRQILAETEMINSMAKEIAVLNDSVQHIEFTGASANDERDRRDQVLKELGQKINIKYSEGKSGAVNVTAGNNIMLVSGTSAGSIEAVAAEERGNKRDGNFEIVFKYGNTGGVVVTDQITGGEMGGALRVRDKVINGILEKIDSLSHNMATNINKAHRRGFDKYGQSGRDFFDLEGPVKDTAQRLRLSEDVDNDVWKIGVAAAPDAPGDNRVANLISSLQHEKWMGDGTATYNDYYNGIVSELAVGIRHSNSTLEHQTNIVDQLKNIRENISGVNLDEEAIKMVEYQKAFDASAKMIRTADEMFQTVLDIKR